MLRLFRLRKLTGSLKYPVGVRMVAHDDVSGESGCVDGNCLVYGDIAKYIIS